MPPAADLPPLPQALHGLDRFVTAAEMAAALGMDARRLARLADDDVVLSRAGHYPQALNLRRVAAVNEDAPAAELALLDVVIAIAQGVTALGHDVGRGTLAERLDRVVRIIVAAGCLEDCDRLLLAMATPVERMLKCALLAGAIAEHLDLGAEIAALVEGLGAEAVHAALIRATYADLVMLLKHDPLLGPGLADALFEGEIALHPRDSGSRHAVVH
jgi:hypothetical protein